MAKKDNLKFKKRIKAQILQEMSQVDAGVSKPALAPALEPQTKISEKQSAVVESPKEKPPIPTVNRSNDSVNAVRQDLKKSAIIIGSIIAVIVIIFFIDLKTGFILKSTGSLFKALNLGA